MKRGQAYERRQEIDNRQNREEERGSRIHLRCSNKRWLQLILQYKPQIIFIKNFELSIKIERKRSENIIQYIITKYNSLNYIYRVFFIVFIDNSKFSLFNWKILYHFEKIYHWMEILIFQEIFSAQNSRMWPPWLRIFCDQPWKYCSD